MSENSEQSCQLYQQCCSCKKVLINEKWYDLTPELTEQLKTKTPTHSYCPECAKEILDIIENHGR